MTIQLDLLADLDVGLCRYGLPKLGEQRPCVEPATHAACWLIPPAYLDGTPNPRAGSGRIECCRRHADYYASAWVPRYPGEVGSAWIDVLAVMA